MKVNFYRIKTNAHKLQWICSKVQEIFLQEKRILIFAPNPEAAQYIDSLLWRTPEESFIPHSISNEPTSDSIVITTQTKINLNHAHYLINLCQTPLNLFENGEALLEIYDETQAQKTESSQSRMKFYQEQNLQVIMS